VTPNPYVSGTHAELTVEMTAQESSRIAELAILVYSARGERISIIDLREVGLPIILAAGQSAQITYSVAAFPLVEGDYHLGVYLVSDRVSKNFLDIISLNVKQRPLSGTHVAYQAMYRGSLEVAVLDKNLRICQS